ncbi:TetR/AcrR family transcriptional regulator [Saccharopolyspora sp. K220]|uniref:TetR/AcrR family transcriptional regulator n=1 Tax=Saccharopolyspora soli TaxID=2926618 RepID=UPI001F5A3B0E|nr:TetR/AcrR family transcriptional regulator [Saccharopolyspora soli]MCI2416617.1 TetR/AcrR family transcriptional regulator [Saccharopolyspora soli]
MARARRAPGRPAADAQLPDLAEILQRGLEAFAELGYEAVSVRQLNEHLGMGHTFIHDRYATKEAFWQAVMDAAVAQVKEEVMAAFAKEQPTDDLARLIASVRAFHQVSARHPHLGRVVDYEAARDSPRLAYLHTLMSPLNNAARPVFDRLVQQGVLRDIPFYLFHFAVTKPLAMYSQTPLARLFDRPDDADDHELLSTVVLNGLLTQPTK